MCKDNIIEENCSICGKGLKSGEGRFRISDLVLCMACYYRKYLSSISVGQKNGCIGESMELT